LLGYLVRRLLWMVPTLVGITMVIFVAIHLAPGDPATVLAGSAGAGEVTGAADYEARLAKFRERHLLDQPLWRQYLHYLGPFSLARDGHRWFGGSGERRWHGLLALDLGSEMHRPGVSVVGELWRRLGVTVPLSLAAVVLSYLVALPLGIWSATHRGSATDAALTTGVFLLYSIPAFWAGLMLVLAFGSGGLGWLPVIGLHDKDAAALGPFAYAWDTFLHVLLPIVTLTYGGLAYLSRQMRAGMIEVLGADFIRTARAKGLPERRVVLRHALRNSLIPVLTLFASILPVLIAGSIVVETIFDIPGMGKYAYEGLLRRDFNVVMATTTFSALLTLVGVLLSDISYALVDPRIRYG
jgi:peptide/nickel transport system permease protein